jgi:hypothetical protein
MAQDPANGLMHHAVPPKDIHSPKSISTLQIENGRRVNDKYRVNACVTLNSNLYSINNTENKGIKDNNGRNMPIR